MYVFMVFHNHHQIGRVKKSNKKRTRQRSENCCRMYLTRGQRYLYSPSSFGEHGIIDNPSIIACLSIQLFHWNVWKISKKKSKAYVSEWDFERNSHWVRGRSDQKYILSIHFGNKATSTVSNCKCDAETTYHFQLNTHDGGQGAKETENLSECQSIRIFICT